MHSICGWEKGGSFKNGAESGCRKAEILAATPYVGGMEENVSETLAHVRRKLKEFLATQPVLGGKGGGS